MARDEVGIRKILREVLREELEKNVRSIILSFHRVFRQRAEQALPLGAEPKYLTPKNPTTATDWFKVPEGKKFYVLTVAIRKYSAGTGWGALRDKATGADRVVLDTPGEDTVVAVFPYGAPMFDEGETVQYIVSAASVYIMAWGYVR